MGGDDEIENIGGDPFSAGIVLEFWDFIEVRVIQDREYFTERILHASKIDKHTAFPKIFTPSPYPYLVIVSMKSFAFAVVMGKPVGCGETSLYSCLVHVRTIPGN
jgi:hypothetical protein